MGRKNALTGSKKAFTVSKNDARLYFKNQLAFFSFKTTLVAE